MTKEQCMDAWGKEIHYTGKHQCTKTIGSRGGEKLNIVRVRAIGKCQIWKRDPNRFRLPVQHGLYEYGEINQDNMGDFHLAGECPASMPRA